MPGTFVFRPIEANLTHDTDWRGKMDPYCAYMINNKRIKGQVCKSGGQHPIWSESTTVPMEVDQPACVVELMDKDMLIDDSIGTFVIDLTEVQNYGTVSKWYPVFHKNKPAGQILFEAAYQPAAQNVHVIQPVIKETVLVEEVPKRAMVEETIIQKEVPTTMTTETFGQSSFISKGGVIPVGSTNLDGGLYGKVVHMEPVSHVRDAHLGAGGLHQDQLPRTQLGGPLSGSLGGGVLGSRELGAGELIGGATTHNVTSYTETQYHTSQLPTSNFQGSNLQGSNFQGSQLGNQPLNQNLGNQYAGSNLPTNFNTTSVSNAQLGGGAPLYKETANHPTANAGNISGQGNLGQGNLGQGNIVPGDLVGGHNQTNQSIGDRNPL